jgi:hypothetical protein
MQRNYGLYSTVAASLVEAPERQRPFPQRDVSLLWVSNVLR